MSDPRQSSFRDVLLVLPEHEQPRSRSPKFIQPKVEAFAAMLDDVADLMMSREINGGLFGKYIGSSKPAIPASLLWNTSFIVDYCLRSRLLTRMYSRRIERARTALLAFSFEPLQGFLRTGRLEPLYRTPRSFPHVVSLKLRELPPDDDAALVDLVTTFYSPNSVGFHEAEFVTLQLIGTLILRLPELGHAAAAAVVEYLEACFAAIDEVLRQNDGVFCNEQVNRKYNALLLLNVQQLTELLEHETIGPLIDGGIGRATLNGFADKLLPTIFSPAKLGGIVEESEYLLYLLQYVAARAVARGSELVWKMLDRLLDELLARYRVGRGIMVSREMPFTFFNYHVPLAVLAYERLLRIARA